MMTDANIPIQDCRCDMKYFLNKNTLFTTVKCVACDSFSDKASFKMVCFVSCVLEIF